jgi:hypothetical protein
LLVVIILTIAFSIACGSGEDGAGVEPTEAPPPPDAEAIRQVDFRRDRDVLAILGRLNGGSLDAAATLYADVTGDRREEAVLPITSGGTQGNLAYLVFTMREGVPALVLIRTAGTSSAGGIRLSVEDGELVETAAVYDDEDPLCCPSELRRTIFRWDGKQLQVQKEEKLPNPNAQKKD